MNKRGWEIAKLAQLIIVVIALIIIFNFVKGKMAYGSGIFSNLFGKVNESIGGVSWGDLTKEQKDIMNDKQKAEAMFIEIDKNLNLGIEKRKNKDFDGAKAAFDKALSVVNQLLNLKEKTSAQKAKATELKNALQYYLKDLETYKDVAEYMEKVRGLEGDEALNILKACEAQYPRSIRSVDCLVRGYILKADLHSKDIIGDLRRWFDANIKLVETDSEKLARLNLAAGEILYQLSLEPNLNSKTLLEEAIKYYNAVTNDLKYKEFYDYIGRAYHRKAQIYARYSKILGLDDNQAYIKANSEYSDLFKKLEKREFVDKQEALREENIIRLNCVTLVVSLSEDGKWPQTIIGPFYLDLYLVLGSRDQKLCVVGGTWRLQVIGIKGVTKTDLTLDVLGFTEYTAIDSFSLRADLRPVLGSDKVLFLVEKIGGHEKATLELKVTKVLGQ